MLKAINPGLLRISLKFSLFAAALSLVFPAVSQAQDFGKPGQPIHLVVGYQPYYTASWSGVVMRSKQFWKKYLPKGSTVTFRIGLQGSVIVNSMLAGKEEIGYMGDMPAIVAATKRRVRDLRLVGVAGVGQDQCNIILVRNSAPKFSSPEEALKWLNGKRVATAKGACSDRFAQAVFKKYNIKPAVYLNQNIQVMTSSLRSGKDDAAVIWEPTASKLVQNHWARRVATGANTDEHSAAFIVMNHQLMKQRPDVVKGWMKAELEAEQYLANPEHGMEVAKMVQDQSIGFKTKTLWASLYAKYPKDEGGAPYRLKLPYVFTPEVKDMISTDVKFLHQIHSINVAHLAPDAVDTSVTESILQGAGLTSPVGKIDGMPMSQFAKSSK